MRNYGALIFGAILSAISGYMFLGELIYNLKFNPGSFFAFLGFALIAFLGKKSRDSSNQNYG